MLFKPRAHHFRFYMAGVHRKFPQPNKQTGSGRLCVLHVHLPVVEKTVYSSMRRAFWSFDWELICPVVKKHTHTL